MQNRIILILLLVAAVAFLLMSQPRSGGEDDLGLVGPAPPITIKTSSGSLISLEDYRGKVVLVDFWATWCGPCAMSIPYVQKAYEQYHGQGFEVIGVAMENDDGSQIPAYAAQMGITYHLGMADPPQQIGTWISRDTGIPAKALVDKKGQIRWTKSGFDPSKTEELGKRVAELLAE